MSRGKNKTKYSESERTRILGELKISGLSFSEFAKQHGVPSSTLHGWQHRSKKKSQFKAKSHPPTKKETTSVFLPIEVKTSPMQHRKIDSKWLSEFLVELAERGVI